MGLTELTSKLKTLLASKRENAKYISTLTHNTAVLLGMEKHVPGFKAFLESFHSDIIDLQTNVDMSNVIEMDTHGKKTESNAIEMDISGSVNSTTGSANVQERLDNALKDIEILELKLKLSLQSELKLKLKLKLSLQSRPKEVEEVIPATLAVLEASQLISDKSVAVTKLPLGEKHKLLTSAPTSKGPTIKPHVVKEIPSSTHNIQRIPDTLVDAISDELHGYTAMVGPSNQTNFKCLRGELHGEKYEVVLVCRRKERLTIPSGTRKVQFQPHPVSAENVLGLDRIMNHGTRSEQVTMLHYACELIFVSVEMYEQVKHMFEVRHMLLIANDLQTSMPKKGKAATVDMSAITCKIIKVVDFDIEKKVIYCVPETMTYAQTDSSAVHRHHWCYTGKRGCLAAHSTVQKCGISAMHLLKSGPIALSKNGQSTAICETELDGTLNFCSVVNQYCEKNNGELTFGGCHQLNASSHLLSMAMGVEKAIKSCVGKNAEFVQKICGQILSAIDNAGRGSKMKIGRSEG